MSAVDANTSAQGHHLENFFGISLMKLPFPAFLRPEELCEVKI